MIKYFIKNELGQEIVSSDKYTQPSWVKIVDPSLEELDLLIKKFDLDKDFLSYLLPPIFEMMVNAMVSLLIKFLQMPHLQEC